MMGKSKRCAAEISIQEIVQQGHSSPNSLKYVKGPKRYGTPKKLTSEWPESFRIVYNSTKSQQNNKEIKQ